MNASIVHVPAFCSRSLLPGRAGAGFSLVEIMVGLVAGLVVAGAMSQLYVTSKHAYRTSEQLARIQENGRYALDVLARELRFAGYLGCRSRPDVLSSNGIPTIAVIANATDSSGTATPLNPFTATDQHFIISGGNDATGHQFASPSPALARTPLGSVVNGTDAMTLQFAEPCGGLVTATAGMTGVYLTGLLATGATCDSTAGDTLLISDCNTQTLFRAAADTTKNATGGTPTDLLGRTYLTGSEVMNFRSYTYYIRENPASQPSLYRLDNTQVTGGNNPLELVEGIENMQIVHGVDTGGDGGVDQYLDADAVEAATAWSQVLELRVTLTVRSVEDNVGTAVRSYSYDGSTVTDRRLAKTFTASFSLRNRQH